MTQSEDYASSVSVWGFFLKTLKWSICTAVLYALVAASLLEFFN